MTDIISIKDINKTLADFLKLLIRKWYVVLISVVVFALLGLTVSLVFKPRYTAKLSFVLEESDAQSSLGSLAGIASQFGLSATVGSSTFNSDNIIEILKSRNIVQKALLTENNINNKNDLLINHYLRFNGYYDNWSDDIKLKNLKFTSSDESKLTHLQDSVLMVVYKEIYNNLLEVDKLKTQLDIIVIKTKSKDELFSKYFAENLIKCVTDFYITTKTHKARETLEFLQGRADSTKNALDAAELQLAKWQDSRIQLVKYEAQIDRAKLMRNVQILQIVYSEILKNLELSKMNLLNITPLVKIIDKPILPLESFDITVSVGIILGIAIGLILTLVFLFIRMLILDAIKE